MSRSSLRKVKINKNYSGIKFNYFTGIFITASQTKDNKYRYDTVLLVLLTEMLKLVVSCVLYCRE